MWCGRCAQICKFTPARPPSSSAPLLRLVEAVTRSSLPRPPEHSVAADRFLHCADLARECYSRGASVAQLRGCVRHLVVFAGYGPCLAATLALHKAKLLPEDAPGKVGGG